MDKERQLTGEVLLYGIFLSVAIGFRLILLGQTPLVDSEASLALQALRISEGDAQALGSRVLYLALTEGLFSLFGAGDYLARLAPAFLGGLIVLVPFCFRERIGRLAALIFAGGLAVDPALVSISRIASGQVPGLVMLLLSLALLHQRKTPWAVFSFVIALFSGPTIWTGLLLIGITILISARVGWIDPRTYLKDRFGSLGGVEQRKTQGWEAYLLPGILILVIGSFFFREIQGLSAWTGSLGEYLVTWTNLPIFRSPEVLIHLGVSGPLILIFGALGLYRSWVDGEVLGKIASVWFGVGLLLLLVYPGRQPGDLIWLSLPLWLGSARELVRIYQLADDHWPIWSLAVLVGTLMILNWLTFTGMVFQGANRVCGIRGTGRRGHGRPEQQ